MATQPNAPTVRTNHNRREVHFYYPENTQHAQWLKDHIDWMDEGDSFVVWKGEGYPLALFECRALVDDKGHAWEGVHLFSYSCGLVMRFGDRGEDAIVGYLF